MEPILSVSSRTGEVLEGITSVAGEFVVPQRRERTESDSP